MPFWCAAMHAVCVGQLPINPLLTATLVAAYFSIFVLLTNMIRNSWNEPSNCTLFKTGSMIDFSLSILRGQMELEGFATTMMLHHFTMKKKRNMIRCEALLSVTWTNSLQIVRYRIDIGCSLYTLTWSVHPKEHFYGLIWAKCEHWFIVRKGFVYNRCGRFVCKV